MNAENKETASVYVSTELRDKKRIETIRDNMLWNISADTFFKRVTPHITLVPPFTMPEDSIDELTELVNEVELPSNEVKINGAAVWRNIRNPYVVMLDVDVDVEQTYYELVANAKSLGGYNFREPVNPHITLFKSKGWWEEVPDTVAWKLQNQIMNNRMVQNTEITDIRLIVN